MTGNKKGIFDGCLLLSDIDGTLVYNGKIPERNKDAITYFIQNGGLFSIATGRSIEATRMYVQEAKVNAGVVTFNGAVIYNYVLENTILNHSLPRTAKSFLLPIIERFPKIGAEVHNLRKLYEVNPTVETKHHMEYEHIFAEDIPLDEVFEQNWTKVLFSTFDGEEMKRLHNYCEKIPLSGCYFLKTADIYYELTCGGINKGTALEVLAKHYHIDHSKVFAIGDYYNDTEMLEKSGISAVAADAPADLKEKADYVACSCEQGCVADFINYLTGKLQA